MTFDEFITKYDGKLVDFDGSYPNQCVDLVEFYNRDVIGAPRLGGNAAELARNPQADFYDKKVNTPFYIPPRGAIAVWNRNVGNGNGHTAIVLEASLLTFRSFDQNWPTGAPCTGVNHNYNNVDCFLVPLNKDGQSKLFLLLRNLQQLINVYKTS